MSKTKEKVFEVAREAKELIRLHPFTLRQTDRQTDRRTDRQTATQTERE